jgi:SAM-dependent methyltransferase
MRRSGLGLQVNQNMATREEWIGPVGQEWARRGAALERLLGPAGAAGLEALSAGPGERIVDLGCGGGTSTLALADAVGPRGRVTGIDVSPDLLALARERLADRANVELVEADAQRHEFAERHDALFSRFGAMFFDDPPAALENLRRALQPGARAVFVAWREVGRNQWASVPMTYAQEGLGAAISTAGPGPFAWADPAVFEPLLEGAGFREVRTTGHEFMAEIADGDDPDPVERAVLFMTRVGPLARRLREAPESARHEALEFLRARLRRHAARHVSDGAVRLLASAWIIETRA